MSKFYYSTKKRQLNLSKKNRRSKTNARSTIKQSSDLFIDTLKCKKCTKRIAGETPFCIKHWAIALKTRIIANSKLPISFNLLELWDAQEKKCAITGIELIPGKTASIDHIVPLCKGGTNDKSNLRFVHVSMNAFKNDLDEEEFYLLLEELIPLMEKYVKKYKKDHYGA